VLIALIATGCTEGTVAADSPPSVDTTNPVSSGTAVAINNSVIATFNEAMASSSLTSESFTVQGASEVAMVGVVSLDAMSNTATFNPTSNLTANTVYTATLTTSVKSASGLALASNYVWTFTTGTTEDMAAPTVNSTNPTDTETGVALNRSIGAVFSESLDPASLNTTTVSLTKSSDSSLVSGEIIYADKLVTFDPTANLVENSLYTVSLSTGVMDLAGNTLAADYTWEFTSGSTLATGPSPVNLLTAGHFVILTKTGITNVPTSAITGDIGASPITAAANDNVSCSEITGEIYGSVAAYTGNGDVSCFKGTSSDNTIVAHAVLDMSTAYNDAAGRTTPDFTELHAGDISGQTLVPGLYKWGTNVLINTDVTLSGSANDVWIFQVSGDVIQAANSSVMLTGGAKAKNVFWQVGGGTGVALDTNVSFSGVVLAAKGITVNTGTAVTGRLLSQTAVTLEQNTITEPAN
jgi:methionine-rich copper-binding protein CopC